MLEKQSEVIKGFISLDEKEKNVNNITKKYDDKEKSTDFKI